MPVICEHNGMIEMYGMHTMDGHDCGRGQFVNGFDDTSSGEPRKVSSLYRLYNKALIRQIDKIFIIRNKIKVVECNYQNTPIGFSTQCPIIQQLVISMILS